SGRSDRAVSTKVFASGIWDEIRLREARFDERAYLFVLQALEFQQARSGEKRHVDGRELARAVRDLALENFGVMARLVLEHWGVTATADVGDIVFTMVDLGLLMSQPTDSRLDFVDVYDFDQAFERSYPWSAEHLS
ncbi:MAG: Minf_1886 family protein, partial [Gemmatimonadaceae bacterium]